MEHIINDELVFYACQDCDLRFFKLRNGEIPTGDDDFYNQLNKLPWYYQKDKYEYHYAKNFIKQDSKILEVGCGSAEFAKFLPCKNNYTGLEFSSDAINMARQNNIDICQTSIEDFAKTHENMFDVACSFQVLEHVKNPHDFIESQIKALKKGGLLIIAVPNDDSFLRINVNGMLNMPPHHISRFTLKCLENIAKMFDMKLKEIHCERVQKEHIDFYKQTIWSNFFLKPRLIDTRLRRKIINRFYRLAKYFMKVPKDAFGHTAIAVYEV